MPKPINIFIIYAREDKEIKQGLLSYLNPFVKPYNLNIWHDAHIQPGQEWKYSIDSRLNQTDLFVMLVSIDFMNSQFIHQVEFKYAVERHKANKSIIIPVITRECPWDIDFEFDGYNFSLKELQVLPDEGKPIVDWKTSDHAFNNIASGIRKVFASIKKNQEQQEVVEKNQKESEQIQIESNKKKLEEEEAKKKKEDEEEAFWILVEEENSVDGYQDYLQKYPDGKHKSIALSVIRTLENINKKKQKSDEEALWKASGEKNTIDSYKIYLDKTELGLYKEQASKLIADIEKKNQEIQAEKERQLKEEQDNKLWKEISGANTIASYKKYLNESKVGLFKEKADQAIKQLEAEQKEKEIEQQFWQKAKTENSINTYNEYLQRYPKGSYMTDASNAIKAIEKKNKEILAEKERQLKEEQDNKLWKEISGANTLTSYKKYLNETKVGLFKEKAEQAIKQLEAEQKEKELENQFWQKAKTENTINSYNEYLQRFTKGSYSTDASNAIKAIEKKNQEILTEKERQLKEEQDNKLWEEASIANTISSYKKYLNDTKLGLFKGKAEQAIKQIEAEQREKELEQQFWQKAKTENSINIYNEYLQRYPKGNYSKEASNAIKAIEKRNQEMQTEKERQLKEEQDNKLWEETSDANTIASFKKYLNETKIGLFKEKAEKVLSLLEAEQKEKEIEKELWEKTKKEASLKSYTYYLEKYPTGSYSIDAKTAVTNIEEARKQEEAAAEDLLNKNKEKTAKKGKSKKYVFILVGIVVVAAAVFGIMKMNSKPGEQTLSEVKEAETTPAFDPVEEKKKRDSDSIAARKAAIGVGKHFEGGIIFQVDESNEHGLIVAEQDIQGTYYWTDALEACKISNKGGYNNWILPTKDELEQLYQFYINSSFLKGFSNSDYWSETTNGAENAYTVNFGTGNTIKDRYMRNKCRVRPIRKF